VKKISRRKFVFCNQIQRDVPLEHDESCCDFFNGKTAKCDFEKYNVKHASKRISYREELYNEFSNQDE
jgi:hypothetical protein